MFNSFLNRQLSKDWLALDPAPVFLALLRYIARQGGASWLNWSL
jgi:hypothetical protein